MLVLDAILRFICFHFFRALFIRMLLNLLFILIFLNVSFVRIFFPVVIVLYSVTLYDDSFHCYYELFDELYSRHSVYIPVFN